MKLVLFDLGDTLESDGVLLPGALETLEAIASLRIDGQPAAVLALLSDFHMPAGPSDVGVIQQQYYTLLEDLGIRQFFEPVALRVTLSTEVGVFKPDEAVFRDAAARVDPVLNLGHVLFITELQRLPGGPSRMVGTYSSNWSRPSKVLLSTISSATSG